MLYVYNTSSNVAVKNVHIGETKEVLGVEGTLQIGYEKWYPENGVFGYRR